MRTVAEVLKTPPPLIRAAEPIERAVEQLHETGGRYLVAVDHEGRAVGVLRAERVVGRRPGEQDVAALVDGIDLRVHVDDPLLDAVLALSRSRSDAAIAVDDADRPQGLLTEADGVTIAAERLSPDIQLHHLRPLDVGTLAPEVGITHALTQLVHWRVRHGVVVDDSGELLGVLSAGDLIGAGGLRGSDQPISSLIAGQQTVSVRDGMSMRAAAERMTECGVGCLPVLDAGGRPVRVLTRTDVLDALAAQLLDHSD